MKIEFTYDWISATIPPESSGYLWKNITFGEHVENGKNKPQFGYTELICYESGARVMWNTERPEMGVHVMLGGSALRWMSEHGSSCTYVLLELHLLGARVSRIDLAIDVFGSALSPQVLCKPNRKPYKGRGRTPKFTQVGDEEDGWTIYVGSRSSDKFLRIYDKKKETGYEGDAWTRIEVECKGKIAHWLGSKLPSGTLSDAYSTASTIIKTLVDFEDMEWRQALSSDVVALAIPKKSDRDTLGWLLKSAVPALARLMKEKPNDKIYETFVKALTDQLGGSNDENTPPNRVIDW